MNENGFYLIKNEFVDLINNTIGGSYNDSKQRPIYCCIKDNKLDGIYWAIPTSDLSHRSSKQISKYERFINLPNKDIRSCYYHIGHTNRPALFKISNVFPVTDKYIIREYISNNKPLVMKNKTDIATIRKKVLRILSYENQHINKLEQHITDIKNYLIDEMSQDLSQAPSSAPTAEPLLPNEIPSLDGQGFGGIGGMGGL